MEGGSLRTRRYSLVLNPIARIGGVDKQRAWIAGDRPHSTKRTNSRLRAALPDTPAEIVDGRLFSWYGPRLLETPSYLKNLRERLPTPRAA